MATPRPATQRGLNQDFPVRLADDLARSYVVMNAVAMQIIQDRLIPAILADDRAAVAVILGEIDLALAEVMPDEKIRELATRKGQQTDKKHRGLFFAGLASAAGIKIIGSDNPKGGGTRIPPITPGVVPTRRGPPRFIPKINFSPTILADQFVDENIRLISTLRAGMVEAIGDQVTRDVFFGGGVTGAELVPPSREELTARLLRQWEEKGVPSRIPTRRRRKDGTVVTVSAENHAAFIARDQISKLNGQFNRARQEAAGITGFVWETRKDSRVRPAHRDLQGKTFTWAEGASGVYPGQPINCRCWARAVVDADQVKEMGEFIDIDSPVNRGTVFTERGLTGVRATSPGPGATIAPSRPSSFDR